MAEEKSLRERFLDMRAKNVENLPNISAQLEAMFREGVRDIRQTVNQVAFGQMEHAPEMGAPMSPTPQMTSRDLGVYKDKLNQAAALAPQVDQSKGMDR